MASIAWIHTPPSLIVSLKTAKLLGSVTLMTTLFVAVSEYIWPVLLLTVKGTGALSVVVIYSVKRPGALFLRKPT